MATAWIDLKVFPTHWQGNAPPYANVEDLDHWALLAIEQDDGDELFCRQVQAARRRQRRGEARRVM